MICVSGLNNVSWILVLVTLVVSLVLYTCGCLCLEFSCLFDVVMDLVIAGVAVEVVCLAYEGLPSCFSLMWFVCLIYCISCLRIGLMYL